MSTSFVRPNFELKVQTTLERLYAEAIETDPAVREAARQQGLLDDGNQSFYEAMKEAYLPVTPDFGTLLYLVARMARARSIVEFGASFGISTIYLAAALRDEGDGKVFSTELIPDKAKQALRNLAEAGLEEWVQIRIGDAFNTLREDLPQRIDLLFLDGPKAHYLPMLKLLWTKLGSGSLIVSDNSEMDGATGYLAYVRDPANGLIGCSIQSSALGYCLGHEILMKQ